MTDIDGAVEINGYFLFTEFKSEWPCEINTGQRVFFERLTNLSSHITCYFIVCLNVETMECTHFKMVYRGITSEWQETSLDDMCRRFTLWAQEVGR